jgi:hypothetical protein
MNITQQYKQIQKDYAYIKNTYGEVFDYCGAWCNNDKMDELLKNPSKQTALKVMISLLSQYYDCGYDYRSGSKDLPVNDDKKLQQIKERWNID